jgi:hypothetical protein
VVGTFVLLSSAYSQSTAPNNRIAGKQFMVARYTKTPPVIDGVFSLAEWGRAVPVYVEGTSSPATPPGVVPNIGLPYLFPPDSPADSSFKIYALYDDNNLYVAVDVTDDIIICDGPVPYLDDDVEILIDGDRRPGDAHNPSIIWESRAGLRPHGFVVEFRIPLSSINTIDTSWFSNPFPGSGFRSPQPGDIIGFNVNVGDDDNGGLSYLRTEPAPHTDSATAWDGRSVGWYIFSEADWGNLYLAPRTDNDD